MKVNIWRVLFLLNIILFGSWYWKNPAMMIGYLQTTIEAYFVFDYPPNPEIFTIKLTDPQKITQAREILSGVRPSRHIMGKVIKSAQQYNPPWSFHLEPVSIVFFDYAIEVCDASIRGVEQNLDMVCSSFLPGCTWCPWGSRLIAEIDVPPDNTPTPTLVKPGQRTFFPLITN